MIDSPLTVHMRLTRDTWGSSVSGILRQYFSLCNLLTVQDSKRVSKAVSLYYSVRKHRYEFGYSSSRRESKL